MIGNGQRRRVWDRRLLGAAGSVRWFLMVIAGIGGAGAGLAIVRAGLLGRTVAGAFEGEGPGDLAGPIAGLVVVAVVGAALAWSGEVAAHHSSARVISALRRRLAAAAQHPEALPIPHGEFLVAGGRSLESLDGYLARYLPSLALAIIVPIAVVAWLGFLDPWSAVIVIVTLPLIPLFASLIGAATRGRVTRRREALAALGRALLESLRALSTLKAFGRHKDRAAAIRLLAEDHRRETMGVLRIALLSSLALELAATISVAVVAVAVGLRVLDGDLSLETAITVLVLAPEAYLPLRRVAGEFHSAVEGVEAAARVFDLEPDGQPASSTAGRRMPPTGRAPSIRVESVHLRAGRRRLEPEIGMDLEPGSWVAVIGPSGSGKSTLLAAVAGLIRPESGRITGDGTDIWTDIDAWRGRVGWMPQDPHLFRGTIAENLRFASPRATDDQLRRALRDAAADFVFEMPAGVETQVGEHARPLSAGERARIALARALVCGADLLVLDEPTAHLDALSELAILDNLDRLRGRTTILLAAHRPAAAGRAEVTYRMAAGRIERSER